MSRKSDDNQFGSLNEATKLIVVSIPDLTKFNLLWF